MTGDGESETILRGPRPDDIEALWSLCKELGYDTPVEPLERRLNSIVFNNDQAAYVAEIDGLGLVGYIHIFTRYALEVEPCAQIQALVVSERARRHGVAAKLMAAAEAWATGRGLTWLSLYCSSHRDAAHAFYPTQGFEAAVVATRFNKTLD
jgi:GNAT superfamily N-acetyltransferase